MSEVQHRKQLKPKISVQELRKQSDNFINNASPKLYTMEDLFYNRLPSHESFLRIAAPWKASKEGPNGKNYLYRSYMFQFAKPCPEVFLEMLKYYGFNLLSTFCSLEEDSWVGLNWHQDDYDVLAFNILGETQWQYYPEGGNKEDFKVLTVSGNKMIYMPSGWIHRVETSGERSSVSLVREPAGLEGLS